MNLVTKLPLVLTALAAASGAQNTLTPLGSENTFRDGEAAFYDLRRGRVTVARELIQLEDIDSVRLATPVPFPDRAFAATAVDDLGNAWVFGGQNANGSVSDELYRWDPVLPGLVVVPRSGAWPGARCRAALAMHRRTGDLVLFGGRDGLGDRADTWLWRSGAWTLLATGPAPSARADHAMAFDRGLGNLVLFGGQSNGTPLGDSWVMEGNQWRALAGAGPSPRFGAVMALDEARGYVVLRGGQVGPTQSVDDTWRLLGGIWQSLGGTSQPGPAFGVLVYDARRQRLVQFGGSVLTPLGRFPWQGTRSWDGAAWVPLGGYAAPAAPPQLSQRSDVMAAFSDARGRFTMFGGTLFPSGAVPAETWEYGAELGGGYGWIQRLPVAAPSARRLGAMASAGGLQFLFGGENALGKVASNDLWQFDGSSWSIRATSAVRPSARSYTTLAHDPVRNKLVIYGGLDQNLVTLGDVWELDLATHTWSPGAGTPPSARLAPALAWHSGRGRILLHGGQLPGVVLSGETFEYDGNKWGRIATTGPGVQQASMAFDANRNRTLLVGGYERSGNGLYPSQNVWEFDGSSWRLVGTGPEFSAIGYSSELKACVAVTYLFGGFVEFFDGSTWQPYVAGAALAARAHHTLTWDPTRRRSMLVSGLQSGVVTGDLWEWDGYRWSTALPVTRLPARESHAACWSPLDGRLMVFGGRNGAGQALGDTWLRDTARNDWLLVDAPGPGARFGHALCLDEPSGSIVLFGGNNGTFGELNDTWQWTRAQGWVPDSSTLPPPARSEHAMAWHAPTAQIVLFGGSYRGRAQNDTWLYTQARGWRKASNSSAPPARYGHTMTYDPTHGRVILAGGYGSGSARLADVWEFDGRDWSEVRLESILPASLQDHAACFDGLRRRVLLSAGIGLQFAWSNVSAGGVGDAANNLPLSYRSQPVVGDPFRLGFDMPANIGLLLIGGGPAVQPVMTIPPPIGCGALQIYMPFDFGIVVRTPEFDVLIPAQPSLVGQTLRLQGLTPAATCWRATDALNAQMLAR